MGHHDLDLTVVARLGDLELMASLRGLVAQDRALTARLLLHLGEVDARGLYREHAFPSMFEYAVEALHMSPDEAYVRLRAAKLAREFPLVLQMLERNELHLSAIKLLGPHLTQANHVEVLAQARSKSKRAVEMIVADLAPKPDVPSSVRKLPAPRPAVRATALPAPQIAPQVAPIQQPPSSAPFVPASQLTASSSHGRIARGESSPQLTTPLSPGRYKVQFTATQTLYDKLQRLKDLMRHQIPDGDLSAIVERAADLLIEQRMKQRFAQIKRKARSATPATEPSQRASRYVPRGVVREVHRRDGGQCTFVSPEGRRCSARGFLELHHEDPYAHGGPSTSQNLKLTCRAHNALLAEHDFGKAFMQDKLNHTRRGKEHRAQEVLGLGP